MRFGLRSFCAWAFLLGPAAWAQVPAGGEFTVNSYTTSFQADAGVAHDHGGNFTVVWSSIGQDGSGTGIVGQRFTAAGARVGGEFQVNTYTSGYQDHPAIAFGLKDTFVVVWTSFGQDGSDRAIVGQRFNADGSRAGSEFAVNAYTTGYQFQPSVAGDDGGFVVVWRDAGRDGSFTGIGGQRFNWSGVRVGAEFTANTHTTGYQFLGSVASDASGRFVVVWTSSQDGDGYGVFGQRFDATGSKVGTEFQVNTYTTSSQVCGGVDVNADGNFAVAWTSFVQDGSAAGIAARRFDASGNGLGADFVVNTTTAGRQYYPWVSSDAQGNFVVTWFGSDTGGYGIFARRFRGSGAARGAEFRVNTYTTGLQTTSFFGNVSADDLGNFAVVWTAGSLTDLGNVQGQRFGGLRPTALRVNTSGNGVLEPGETVDVRPTWLNTGDAGQIFGGTLSNIAGPAGGVYAIPDGNANYGAVAGGSSQECTDCYTVSVTGTRPSLPLHVDVTALEGISPDSQGQHKPWRLHVGGSFTDVPTSSPFYRFIETLLHRGVTGGCTGDSYCPSTPATRDQMAVFVLAAKEGAGYAPAACTTPVFNDVPASSPFCRFIEELARRGVVNGCGGGNYCPSAAVSRDQMAVFVLRTLDPTLTPPACVAGSEMFADVPAGSGFCKWIEELARRGIVTGCGGGNYCPTAGVTREQMAVFLTGTFGLTLYGPF